MSYRQAVEAYDVPKSTIADHVKSNIKLENLEGKQLKQTKLNCL
jgi:hypothetical protein